MGACQPAKEVNTCAVGVPNCEQTRRRRRAKGKTNPDLLDFYGAGADTQVQESGPLCKTEVV